MAVASSATTGSPGRIYKVPSAASVRPGSAGGLRENIIRLDAAAAAETFPHPSSLVVAVAPGWIVSAPAPPANSLWKTEAPDPVVRERLAEGRDRGPDADGDPRESEPWA